MERERDAIRKREKSVRDTCVQYVNRQGDRERERERERLKNETFLSICWYDKMNKTKRERERESEKREKEREREREKKMKPF